MNTASMRRIFCPADRKQRIAIAGVLAMEPSCVVFDEPTAMLDPAGRESIVEIIKQLASRW